MSSDQEREHTAPSNETLRGIFGMVKSYIKQKQEGASFRKGKVKISASPRKVCPICAKLFDLATAPTAAGWEIQKELCETCKESLSQGYTACVCAEDYAFIKSSYLANLAGQIMLVTPEVMKKLKERHQSESDQKTVKE